MFAVKVVEPIRFRVEADKVDWADVETVVEIFRSSRHAESCSEVAEIATTEGIVSQNLVENYFEQPPTVTVTY